MWACIKVTIRTIQELLRGLRGDARHNREDSLRDIRIERTTSEIPAGSSTTGAILGPCCRPSRPVRIAAVCVHVHPARATQAEGAAAGEVLGSLRCDCRAQLDAALARIGQEGRGVLVYLVQEGRGIGLGNKVAAYQLQDGGADTVDANLALGFDADLRSYDLAAGILRDLGVPSVRLMTNNPQKIAGLESAGVTVDAHEPHWVGATEHSESYLSTKKTKLGHLS